MKDGVPPVYAVLTDQFLQVLAEQPQLSTAPPSGIDAAG